MKDLFDAVKDAYSQNEPVPAAEGWQKVRTSMRRASLVRSLACAGGTIAACAACVLLFVHVHDSSIEIAPEYHAARQFTAEAPSADLPVEESAAEAIPSEPVKSSDNHGRQADAVADAAATSASIVAPDFQAVPQTPPQTSRQYTSQITQQTAEAPIVAGTEPTEVQELQPDDWWTEESAPKNKLHVKVGLSASTSPISSTVSNVFIPQMDFLAVLKSNNFANNHTPSEMKFLYSNSSSGPTSVSYSHDLPLGLGIALNFPLSHRLSFETGLNYTYLHSVEDDHGFLSDQRLHLAGIPLRAEFALIRRRAFSLYAGAGATLEKCLKASIGSRTYSERRLQCSGEAFAGAEYNIWKNTSLYLQPTVSYWFTETDLITYRTENPLVFSISAGIRFHL